MTDGGDSVECVDCFVCAGLGDVLHVHKGKIRVEVGREQSTERLTFAWERTTPFTL